MSAKSALAIILLWSITFGCGGALIGAAIGVVAPGYYRSVIRHGDSPDFDALQVGIGLGATQGIVLGVVAAIAVLGLCCCCCSVVIGLNFAEDITFFLYDISSALGL